MRNRDLLITNASVLLKSLAVEFSSSFNSRRRRPQYGKISHAHLPGGNLGESPADRENDRHRLAATRQSDGIRQMLSGPAYVVLVG